MSFPMFQEKSCTLLMLSLGCPQGKQRTKTQLQVTEAGVDPGVEIGGLITKMRKRTKIFFSVPHSLSSP